MRSLVQNIYRFALAAACALVMYVANPAQAQEHVYIYGGRAGGYDTAYCPQGYQIEYCNFNSATCDNEQQGRNFCSADSRNNRQCQFTGLCRRVAPRRTYVYGGRAGGYDTAWCPAGFRMERCDFDSNNCDNTRQSANSCSADSRNNRQCSFRGTCVSY